MSTPKRQRYERKRKARSGKKAGTIGRIRHNNWSAQDQFIFTHYVKDNGLEQ